MNMENTRSLQHFKINGPDDTWAWFDDKGERTSPFFNSEKEALNWMGEPIPSGVTFHGISRDHQTRYNQTPNQ